MLNEESTVKEMREFAAKTNITIPKDKTSKKDIFEFLKNPDPAAAALNAQKAKEQGDKQAKTKSDKFNKAAKKPLNEKEKAYLAELELLARSGKQPNTDQMRDLGLLRARKKITKLSVIEQNELAELEVRRQNPEAVQTPSSGVTEEERFHDLEARKDIE